MTSLLSKSPVHRHFSLAIRIRKTLALENVFYPALTAGFVEAAITAKGNELVLTEHDIIVRETYAEPVQVASVISRQPIGREGGVGTGQTYVSLIILG